MKMQKLIILLLFFLLLTINKSFAEEFEVKHADSLEADQNEIKIKGNIFVIFNGARINGSEGIIKINEENKPYEATFFNRAKIELKDRNVEADKITILIPQKTILAEGNTASELNDSNNNKMKITSDSQTLNWKGEDATAKGNLK